MKKTLLAVAALLVVGTLQADTLRCESMNGKYRECRTSGGGRVVLTQQLSDTSCVEGKTWGSKNGMVWVRGGCRGEFALTNESAGTMLTCESLNNGRHTCRADVRGGVSLARRLSGNACVRGKSWGTNDEGIWVDEGCRARFLIGDAGSVNQRAYARPVVCESQNNGRTNCNADTSYGVLLTRQISKSSCNLGSDWGYDHNGIWVTNGCRAEFTVGGYRGGTNVPSSMASSTRPAVTCASEDGQRNYCRANTSFGVTLRRQLSNATCERGRSWGYDENGIWVDQGCRGEFVLDAMR